MTSTEFIKGVIPAVVTPMQADGQLDDPGLRRLIDHLIAQHVHGIFTIGTAGEFWALTTEEKWRVFDWTVDLPVLLYTNPDRTGNDLSPALVERLATEVDHIAGIKDSSGNLSQTA